MVYSTDDLTMTRVYLRAVEGFGSDNWLMLVKRLDNHMQHPPSAHLPSLFHLSQEKVREYLWLHAISSFVSVQVCVGFSSCGAASDSKIHVNRLEFHKIKWLLLLLRWRPHGLALGVTGTATELFYFWPKKQEKGISCRKRGSIRVHIPRVTSVIALNEATWWSNESRKVWKLEKYTILHFFPLISSHLLIQRI